MKAATGSAPWVLPVPAAPYCPALVTSHARGLRTDQGV
jgi:hypothetical protein